MGIIIPAWDIRTKDSQLIVCLFDFVCFFLNVFCCVFVICLKEPKKRTPAHDEADHRALKMMTRQRVYWSLQEDSLMMLCSVAAHLFNSKVRTHKYV